MASAGGGGSDYVEEMTVSFIGTGGLVAAAMCFSIRLALLALLLSCCFRICAAFRFRSTSTRCPASIQVSILVSRPTWI
jgi:hypothetical protein